MSAEITVREDLAAWVETYFQYEVTTLESSQKVQRRDIGLFLDFLRREAGETRHRDWTPRFSQAFKTWLSSEIDEKRGRRRWNDRTVNRILAHLRTLAKWIHRHHPFPLDNPMRKIKSLPAASLLEIERALTPQERRRILDAADLLVTTGGRSKDRNRYPDPTNRPQRKNYRPWRNRAIIYTLIETGMRRAAVTPIRLSGIDTKRRTVETVEKGGMTHRYAISREGMAAIQDFLEQERPDISVGSPLLYASETGEVLSPKTINDIWRSVCRTASVIVVLKRNFRKAQYLACTKYLYMHMLWCAQSGSPA